jgi:hypothetical protein
MKADSLKISKVFSSGGDVHYMLPHFQREYAWEKENWQTLLNDVIGLHDEYNPEKQSEHFMGALARHNRLGAEELDFIINYDVKYRMGASAGEDGNDE